MKKCLAFAFFMFIIISCSYSEESKFQIGMDFHYEGITTELMEMEYMINSLPQGISSDDISRFNRIHSFYNYQYNTGIRISYFIIDDFKIDGFFGISFLDHETYLDGGKTLDQTFSNSSPGSYYGGGLTLSHHLYDKISVIFYPHVKYTLYSNIIYSDPNKNSEKLYDTDLQHSFFFYAIPIKFQYDLGLLKPSVGICYFNYLQDVRFHGRFTDDFGDNYEMDRDYLFHHNSLFGFMIGLLFEINDRTDIVVDGVITDGTSANITFQFDI